MSAPPRRSARARKEVRNEDATANLTDSEDEAPSRRRKAPKGAPKAPKAKPAPPPPASADGLAAAGLARVAGTGAVDSSPDWPPGCRLRRLDGLSWRSTLAYVAVDFDAAVHLQRLCRRGAALARVLCAGGGPPGWRIHLSASVPKRARDTLWRISRPSPRMAAHLAAGTCCLCGKPWTGAVLEPWGVFAHEACARPLLAGLDYVKAPESDRKRRLPRQLRDRLFATPTGGARYDDLPKTTLQGYGYYGVVEYDAVWGMKSWVVPDCFTVDAALDACEAGRPAGETAAAVAAVKARVDAARRTHDTARYREAAAARAKLERAGGDVSSLTVPEIKLLFSVFYSMDITGGKGGLVASLEERIKADPGGLEHTLDEYLSRNEPGARYAEATTGSPSAPAAQRAQQQPPDSVLDANLADGQTIEEILTFFPPASPPGE